MNRLNQKYKETVVPALMKQFNYKSVMEVPYIDKVVINMGVGDAIANSKALDEAVAELAAITGQAPVVTKAKKSYAPYKYEIEMLRNNRFDPEMKDHILADCE